MRWANYHGHCNYCDGKGKIEDYVVNAIEFGMDAIGISSHAPVPFETTWTMRPEKLTAYLSEIKDLKEKYKDDIVVLTSLEVDYIPGLAGPVSELIKSSNLDYVIGSIHFMGTFDDGEHWAIDGSFNDFLKGLHEIYNDDMKKVVSDFYSLQRDMVTSSAPDIIGHMDKIKMHNLKREMFDESSVWYRDELRHTLEVIKEYGTIVEINTKAFPAKGMLFPGRESFSWLKELRIPVTINSDAHTPGDLLNGFREVAAMLQEAGIEYLHEFIDGRWKAVRI